SCIGLNSRFLGFRKDGMMKKIALEINGKELKVYMADSFATRFRGLMLEQKHLGNSGIACRKHRSLRDSSREYP
ncbi:MAG: hypothetical protein SPE92_06925, partial [Anaerovibrio sp.]|nr:hypothetical protein [Anaerovibrio sp.]